MKRKAKLEVSWIFFFPDTSRYRRNCVKHLQTKCILMSISKYQVMHSVLTCDALQIQKIKLWWWWQVAPVNKLLSQCSAMIQKMARLWKLRAVCFVDDRYPEENKVKHCSTCRPEVWHCWRYCMHFVTLTIAVIADWRKKL